MPIVIKLVKAPVLDKQEIAKFFIIDDKDFEIIKTNDKEGICSYYLQVQKSETAVQMFTQYLKNRVFSLSIILLEC